MRIAGLKAGHVPRRQWPSGEVIGQPQVGGGPHYLADPVPVDHPKQGHHGPVAEALVFRGTGRLGVLDVGMSHAQLAPCSQ
jgi:hypothetical protein